jgi:excisionase family DNA binding protein
MEILDRKSEVIHSFFTGMYEMSETINRALKNRTPHLNGEKFLTREEVCKMLHVSVRTLQEWRKQGKIPFIRLRGKILYKESEVLSRLERSFE